MREGKGVWYGENPGPAIEDFTSAADKFIMEITVFYSWQSDLPNSTNRGFIQEALEKAAKAIRADESVTVEPVIDRDTLGVPGSPNIASTILEKIESANIFVCDVSIINPNRSSDCRPTPNPNVLIELGYAMKVLGYERVIMILNTAYCTPEQLPFDLRMNRTLSYTMTKSNQDKASERDELQRSLERAIQQITETSISALPATPDVSVKFVYARLPKFSDAQVHKYSLRIFIENRGTQKVTHYKVVFSIPEEISAQYDINGVRNDDHIEVRHRKGKGGFRIVCSSTDILFPKETLEIGAKLGLTYKIDNEIYLKTKTQDLSLNWELYADDMTPQEGKIPFSDLNDF